MTSLFRKRDLILLCVLLAAGLLSTVLVVGLTHNSGEVAVVTVDGEEYARLPLEEDTRLVIEGRNGGTNVLVISDRKAYIEEASCPDKVCVRTGHATEVRSIVCLPNRVTVTVEQQ